MIDITLGVCVSVKADQSLRYTVEYIGDIHTCNMLYIIH